MAKLTKHARGFIHDVVSYIQKGHTVNQAVPGLRKLLSKVSKDAQDDITAHVHSAVPLSHDEKLQIQKALTHICGHDITIVSTVSPSTLGGIKIQIRDWVVDMTFLKTLQNMSLMLME
jgi:F-type H+-transporting ATPase subunit delta